MSDGWATSEPLAQAGWGRTVVTPKVAFVVGVLVMSACVSATLLMVLAHFDAVELPGCGKVSDCTRASASRWGKIPGTNWPLSFAGFAYFQALAAAFFYSGGRLAGVLRWMVGVGAVASTSLTIVMFKEGYLCGYCLAIHVLNIAFALGYELYLRLCGRQSMARPNCVATLVVFLTTFVATSLLLAGVDRRVTLSAEQAKKEQLQQALSLAAVGTHAENGEKTEFGPGRYYLGPKDAPVHVVVVSDYQCPSCRTIDAQLRAAVAGRSDVSITARHFPFCTDCNQYIDKTRHLNACRAALAAEAAGMVGGADAFWRMHDWLFERHGTFTDKELRQFVQELGLDWDAFLAALQNEDTLKLIRSDAAAADAAGLRFTPMVFINGKTIDIAK